MTQKMTRKGILKRETETLFIAVQNNAMKTNDVKVKIYKIEENNIYRLNEKAIK